jgi:zinc transporter ZupT
MRCVRRRVKKEEWTGVYWTHPQWIQPHFAGVMVYVVFSDIIPEALTHNNQRLVACSVIAGFIVMMILEIALPGG